MKSRCYKKKIKTMSFFMNASKNIYTPKNDIPQSAIDSNDHSIDLTSENDEETKTNVSSERSYPKPAQQKTKENIISLTQKASVLVQANNSTMSSEIQKELAKTRQEIENETRTLKRKQKTEAQHKMAE
ncbi:uncharacterized protein LOC111080673 [Drosophila obscura]|uniref:uncharacterized protein LOC111080673 n=1 Tax=Drosophila obscura TaxID=7282 RepID=UPI001BB0DE8A|nr:uncharacterized protein LOC111080673 [Drosophila obscura]